MQICGIYKITSPSNRVYIGQSVNIVKRLARYKVLDCILQVKIYRSLLKYGHENHTFEIIEECDKDDLNCRERFWQDEFDVLNGGLNCNKVECGEKRRVVSDETKNKMSIKALGRVHTASTKELQRESKKGYKNPMYGKSGELSPTFGRKHTEENIKNIKEGLSRVINPKIGTNITDEHKKCISDYNSKTVFDKDTNTFYSSAKEASEVFGIKYSTLRCYLNGNMKNKTNLEYYNKLNNK